MSTKNVAHVWNEEEEEGRWTTVTARRETSLGESESSLVEDHDDDDEFVIVRTHAHTHTRTHGV